MGVAGSGGGLGVEPQAGIRAQRQRVRQVRHGSGSMRARPRVAIEKPGSAWQGRGLGIRGGVRESGSG